MEYQIYQDIENIIEILDMSQAEFASDIGVSRVTVSNWCSGKTAISKRHINLIYEYAFEKGIRLNKIKEQLYREVIINGC